MLGYIGTRVTFIKETDKYCDVIYKNYNSLEEAKANCKDDKVCIAIVDEKCNNLGHHNLCTKISNSSSLGGSCIYRKGKYESFINTLVRFHLYIV